MISYDIPQERFPERPPWLSCEHSANKMYWIFIMFSFCTLKEIKMITIVFSTFYADLRVLFIYSEILN